MPRPLEFDIGLQLTSEIDSNGFESCQVDAEGEGQSGVAPYEKHHFHCFWGRALDPVIDQPSAGQPGSGQPNPAKAAQMLYAMEGSQGHAFTMEDPRAVAIIPLPDPGCGAFYGVNNKAGADGQSLGVCFFRTHEDGRLTASTTTTNGGEDGETVFFEVSGSSDQHGFQFVSPTGRMMFGKFGPWQGYSLATAGGSRFSMGYAGGLVPGMGATIRLQTHLMELQASVLKIGPEASIAWPVVQMNAALIAHLQAIPTALTALVAAISAGLMAPSGGGPVTFPGVGAATSAISTLAAAITAILADPACQTLTAIG